MRSPHDCLILTNNPLVRDALGSRYEIAFFGESSYREVLVKARDLVYGGHGLLTHPLAGSVKPNETPYRSVVLTRSAPGLTAEHAEIIGSAVETFDKFTPRDRVLTERMLRDFRLIDYTLLCGALDVDAAAGLSILTDY